MKWELLTSPKIGQMSRQTPVILNIGAIEQHGPHLPVITDALIGEYFTDRIDSALGNEVLILPQVSICCSEHHMSFPGTLTVSHETFMAYVSDILKSVVAHGFTNIILFNSHGGNLAIGQVIMEKLGHRHPEINFFMLTWWKVAAAELKLIQESDFGGVGHACELETSMLMAIAPDLIDVDKIKDTKLQTIHEWADADMLTAGKASHQRSMKDLTAGTGVFGAPSFATAEKGQKIVDIVSQELITIVADIFKK